MTGFKIYPASIKSAGHSLTAAGESFGDRLAAVEAATAAYDGVWGDDAIGTHIGVAYTAVAQWAFDCWHTIAEEFSFAGEDLVSMAEAYEQAETDAPASFPDLLKQLSSWA